MDFTVHKFVKEESESEGEIQTEFHLSPSFNRTDRREIIVRGQSYGWRLPKYGPPTPLPPGECIPHVFGAG
jgi:hypothetical protein